MPELVTTTRRTPALAAAFNTFSVPSTAGLFDKMCSYMLATNFPSFYSLYSFESCRFT